VCWRETGYVFTEILVASASDVTSVIAKLARPTG